MPIGISDEHVELAASVRKWAESQGSIAATRAAETDPDALAPWGALPAEMGLTAIALPEAVGGGGGTLLDQAVVVEAAGYALVPGPFLTTVVAGLLHDDAELRSGIAAGEATVALGIDPRGVIGAGSTTHVSLPGADGRQVLVQADAVEIVAGEAIDPTRTVGEVNGLDSVAGAAPRELIVLAAAEASGIARWCLDTAVDYAKVREQFGKKIGAFQAVKHLCAEMLEISESVTAAAWDAAEAFDRDRDQAEFAAGVAATICFDGAVEVAKACIQVLGGIGF